MEMNNVNEKIAYDKNLAIGKVNDILEVFSKLLANKIPGLKQVIEDVVADEKSDRLKEHINKMIFLLQQRYETKFTTWSMPEQNYISRRSGNGTLF